MEIWKEEEFYCYVFAPYWLHKWSLLDSPQHLKIFGTQTPIPLNNTLNAQVVPVIPPSPDKVTPPLPNDLASYTEKGYGNWPLEKANGYTKRTELLPSNTKPSTKSTPLTQFFTMSDIHIVDIQSATQPCILVKNQTQACSLLYSGSMLYSTQTLNTAIKSVNQLNKSSKIDFGIFLGDAVNNAQKNELEMYLDIIEGRLVNPNSNPSMTYNTDYMQSFKAEGLDVPWYQVLGIMTTSGKVHKTLRTKFENLL